MKLIMSFREMLDIYCACRQCRNLGTSSETIAEGGASIVNTQDMLFMYLKNFYILNKQWDFILRVYLPSRFRYAALKTKI